MLTMAYDSDTAELPGDWPSLVEITLQPFSQSHDYEAGVGWTGKPLCPPIMGLSASDDLSLSHGIWVQRMPQRASSPNPLEQKWLPTGTEGPTLPI